MTSFQHKGGCPKMNNTYTPPPVINNNPFIQNMPTLVENYGLTGRFFERQDLYRPELNGLYFVTGLDAVRIAGDKIDIDEIFTRNIREPNYFHSDIDIIPVDDNEPVARFMDVIEYAKTAEFMQHVWQYVGEPAPTKMLLSDLKLAEMYYTNIPNDPATYTESLRTSLQHAKASIDPSNPRYSKLEPEIKGWYDHHQSKLLNWIRIHILHRKNQISLEALSERATAGTFKLTFRSGVVARVITKELKKHPEILFHKSKPKGHHFHLFPKKEGFAAMPNIPDNDMRFTDFYFDANFANDVETIVNELAYTDAIERTPDEIARKHGAVMMITLPQTEYLGFIDILNKNNIDWCFNTGNKAYWDARQIFVVPLSAQEIVSSYLQERCVQMSNEHILCPEDRKTPTQTLFQTIEPVANQPITPELPLTNPPRSTSRASIWNPEPPHAEKPPLNDVWIPSLNFSAQAPLPAKKEHNLSEGPKDLSEPDEECL